MIETNAGVPLKGSVLRRYMSSLVNSFFKILPLWEEGDPSLVTYMKTFQAELLGCQELIVSVHEDPMFVSLVATLQYLIDNQGLTKQTVKRTVFNAISTCNNLAAKYAEQDFVQ